MSDEEALPTQFRSNFKCFVQVVRHGHKIYHPVTGTETGEVKRLAAEFGIHSGEYTLVLPDGSEGETYADIRGHYFDADVAAELNDWTPEEKEAVQRKLIWQSKKWPEAVQVITKLKVAKPWKTYDATPAEDVAQWAINLAQVGEALAYERENLNRPEVVADLEATPQLTADEVAELVAND